MSWAERTKERATKSASSSTASSRSMASFSVIAGSSGRACVTLMPLRGARRPGEIVRQSTSPGRMASTAKRGTPSPITTWLRSVTRREKPTKSTITRPGPGPSSENVIVSPVCITCSAVSPFRRSFGPWRSNSRPSGRPQRWAASRTSAARRLSASASPWEQFSRAQSIPAATRRSRTPGASVAGPSVATIFVRRSSMRGSLPIRSGFVTELARSRCPLSPRAWHRAGHADQRTTSRRGGALSRARGRAVGCRSRTRCATSRRR